MKKQLTKREYLQAQNADFRQRGLIQTGGTPWSAIRGPITRAPFEMPKRKKAVRA